MRPNPRLAVLSALLASGAVAQTTTNCSTMGSYTNCQTSAPPPASDPYGNLVRSLQQTGIGSPAYQNGYNIGVRQREAAEARQRESAQVAQDQQRWAEEQLAASNARRSAAYDRVGALIADGKCEDAKRLAAFYGHADIVADTAKACP